MRVYSQLLSEAMNTHEDTLFTFDYEFPEVYKPVFERKFLLRFGYRNIGYDSYQMFKQMLESRLSELMPRYLKLYESENIEFNPFVNTRNKASGFNRINSRGKSYATANNKNHSYNNSSGSRSVVGRTGRASGSNENSLTSGNSVNSRRGIADRGATTLNTFTDTPQTPVQAQAGDGAGDGTEAESAKYFNDGYVTTANRDKQRETNINSSSDNGWNNQAAERGITAYDNEGSSSNGIDESKQLGGGVAYSDNEAVNAGQSSHFTDTENEGLNGVLMSDALIVWRRTFLNIDAMLLDELEPLFMGIF